MKARGFTLVELVVTIAIAAIIAVVAAPRFFQASTFDSRGFYDKSVAVVRLAQKTAVAWRRPVYLCVTATEVIAASASGCAPASRLSFPVSSPKDGASARAEAPAGVTLNPLEIFFDGLGRPSAAATITFTSSIAGDPLRQIVVSAETGYVIAN
ncbi:MAG: GspH/FimT family protein [Burkholderiales bacterium]|nr:GspH/FimT family protein [Burkholderiales bacterium]